MHPKERVISRYLTLKERGEPIPLDLLAEADQLGLSLELFDEPTFINNAEITEGD